MLTLLSNSNASKHVINTVPATPPPPPKSNQGTRAAPPPAHPAHTCRKVGRSCMRNIVSFKQLPGRNAFRRVGRAFTHGVRSVMAGYGLKNLSKGRDSILEELGKQFSRTPKAGNRTCCVGCGACMSGPTLYTADVGQAYEMVRPDTIESSFTDIFNSIKACSKHPDPTISVIHSTKAKAKYGGWVPEKMYDRSVFFLSKVAHCMRTLVQLRYYRFGNLFLFQKSGIPIRGSGLGSCSRGRSLRPRTPL